MTYLDPDRPWGHVRPYAATWIIVVDGLSTRQRFRSRADAREMMHRCHPAAPYTLRCVWRAAKRSERKHGRRRSR